MKISDMTQELLTGKNTGLQSLSIVVLTEVREKLGDKKLFLSPGTSEWVMYEKAQSQVCFEISRRMMKK